MTRQRLGQSLGLALKIATIVALIGSPIAAYVATWSKLGVIEYKIDEYIRETRELRAAVTALQLADKDLVTTDKVLTREVMDLKGKAPAAGAP